MKKTCILILVLLLGSLFLSCNQDSIFFAIYNEPPPKDPFIAGTPTNLAYVDDGVNKKIYAGTRMSKKIYSYENGGWNRGAIRLPGALGELASAGGRLYALVFPGGEPTKSSVIYCYNSGSWTPIDNPFAGSYSIQSLYGAGDKIFAGVQSKSNYQSYAILCSDVTAAPGSSLIELSTGQTSILKGAAAGTGSTTYYLVAGREILESDGTTASNVFTAPNGNAAMNGIIHTGVSFVAVSNNGDERGSFYVYDGTNWSVRDSGVAFTGGLCVWKRYAPIDPANPSTDPDPWKPALLLMGIRGQGTSKNQGYRELDLAPDGDANSSWSLKTPGDGSPTSVGDRNKYAASLGIRPVESIFQVPPSMQPGSTAEPLIFASTSQSGIWSYRGGVWNAEE